MCFNGLIRNYVRKKSGAASWFKAEHVGATASMLQSARTTQTESDALVVQRSPNQASARHKQKHLQRLTATYSDLQWLAVLVWGEMSNTSQVWTIPGFVFLLLCTQLQRIAGSAPANRPLAPSCTKTGWWFQPFWKILVNWNDYSQYMEK